MDRRHELASHKTKQDARREVVLSDAVSELEVLPEHGREGEGHGFKIDVRSWGRRGRS